MSERAVTLRRAADVRAKPPRWAWADRIPLGAVSLLAGREGLGKSSVAVELGAQATRGELAGDLHGHPAHVIYASSEDSPETTLVPRLLAAGADLDQVSFLEVVYREDGAELPGALTLPDDTPALADVVRQADARLLVLDPLVSYLHGEVNAHRDQHVRRVLAPLARLATDHDLAVHAIVHLNKGDTTDVLARVGGSVGFTAAARSVLLFGPDPGDPEGENGSGRILAHAKCNVGPKQRSLLARIESCTVHNDDGDTIATSRVLLLGETDQTARDLLAQPDTAEERTARDEAADFLRAELTDGPVPAQRLKAAAAAAGIAWRTVERAKKTAGARSSKEGSSWAWELGTPPPSLNGVVGGLGGVPSLEPNNTAKKAAKAAKAVTANGQGDLASLAQDEADRIAAKWGNEGEAR